MKSMQKIVVWIICVLCPACRLCWAEDAQVKAWAAPLVQQARMPAGVQGCVFYPEHDELIIIKPGAWEVLDKEGKKETTAIEDARGTEGLSLPVTLSGRLKLLEVLKVMADVMNKDLLVGAGVQDSDVAVDMQALPASRALHYLLYPLGYGFKCDADELFILARDTRMFRLNLPPLVQGFNATTTNESSSAASSGSGVPGKMSADGRMRVGARVMVENSSGAMSYWQDIEANLKGILSPAGVLSLNKAAGVAVVTDTPRELEKISAFLDEVNQRSSQQIMVDVKVVEVALFEEHRLGIDWSVLGSLGDLKGLALTTDFAAQHMTGGSMITFSGHVNKEGSGDAAAGVKVMLKALESFGRVEVVSQPRVMMLNNSVASIQVGETRAYVESTNMETTSSGGVITSAVLSEVHGGVTLQIVGSIAGDDVFLGLTPVVSTIDGIRTITLGGGNKLEAPDTSMKTMSTLVRVKAGRTVMIGGLITRDRAKERHGVPFLSRLPVLGKVFSYEVRRNDRTELVIFMTPRKG